METNKVVRSEGIRVREDLQRVGVTLLVMMALLTLVVCATVTSEGRKTREAMAVEQMFDTQVLETWCSGEDIGTIRMVGAWVYSTQDDCSTLEDEQGNLWEIEGEIDGNSFLLLWLADNNTTIVEDDVIIKVWTEWYNQTTASAMLV